MISARHSLAPALLLAALLPVSLPGGAAAQDPPKGNWRDGKAFAEKNCSRCHVIGDFNPFGGIGSTPSFQLLARRDDWLERFLTFYVRRPHPAVIDVPGLDTGFRGARTVQPLVFELDRMDDLIAFIEWLEAKEEGRE
jgi:hypothetical protein